MTYARRCVIESTIIGGTAVTARGTYARAGGDGRIPPHLRLGRPGLLAEMHKDG
jgi:hypothetical protein